MNDAFPDDCELLRRFAADRSETAFAAFVERRIGFVYGAALRRTAGDAQLSGEIAQTVFLIASQKAEKLARHACLAGWLHATTSHVARTVLRDERLRRQREQEAAALNASEDNTAASAVQKHMREILDEALDMLGQKDREALLLRFFEGRGFAEIGAALKTNEDAARMRVSRALEKLRILFARRGVTSTAAALGTLMSAEAAAVAPAGLAASISGAILAGGGATAASTAAAFTSGGIFAFMSTAKTTVAIAIVALLAAGVATRETLRARAATQTLTAAQAEQAQLREQIAEAERLARVRAAAETRSQGVKSLAEALTALNDPAAAGEAFLAAHPEMREILQATLRAGGAGMDYLACLELGMTAAQRAEIEKIRPSRLFELPKKGFPEMFFNFSSNDGQDWQSKQHAFLEGISEGGAKQWEETLKQTFVSFRVTMPLAQSLYYTDTPLTADQARQLATTYWQFIDRPSTLGADNWDGFIEQARPVLSQPQLEALDALKSRIEW